MNSIVLLFSIAITILLLPCGVDIWHSLATQRHTHNTTQNNTTTTTPPLVRFTYKTMAEVLGAVASAVAVVEAAGKVWSTGWKYYQVRIPPKKFEP